MLLLEMSLPFWLAQFCESKSLGPKKNESDVKSGEGAQRESRLRRK